MGSVLPYLLLFWCLGMFAECAPWRNYEPPIQACGEKLSQIMSLLCAAGGYNDPFGKDDHSSVRRFKRQIVEECCRRSCSPEVWQLYCRAVPSEISSNAPIRKRSDSVESTEVHQTEDVTKKDMVITEEKKITQNDRIAEIKDSITTTKEGKENYKLFNLLTSSEHLTNKQKTRSSRNELISPSTNDTAEDEFYKQTKIPIVRHHKNPHHMLRHKASAKTKKEKKASGENVQSFQIGTVKPYFAGKALASYRNNYIHHAPPPS